MKRLILTICVALAMGTAGDIIAATPGVGAFIAGYACMATAMMVVGTIA